MPGDDAVSAGMVEIGVHVAAAAATHKAGAPHPPPRSHKATLSSAAGASRLRAEDEARLDKLDKLLHSTGLYSQFIKDNIEEVMASPPPQVASSMQHATAAAAATPASASARHGSKKASPSSLGKRKTRGGGGSGGGDGSGSDDAESAEEEARWKEETRALLPLVTGGALRPYQLKGVRWLISLHQNGLNGILADQMGLGKTVQCIGLISYLQQQGYPGPYLVVGPLSTLPNWMSEFKRWAPAVPCLLFRGTKEEKKAMLDAHLGASTRKSAHQAHAKKRILPVVVTNYEVLVSDINLLKKYAWKFIVVDEAHRLKNYNCRLIRELRSLAKDPRDPPNKLLLTGTPLQNSLPELWSLLNFIMPEAFSKIEDFMSWFEEIGGNGDVEAKDEGEEGEGEEAKVAEEVSPPNAAGEDSSRNRGDVRTGDDDGGSTRNGRAIGLGIDSPLAQRRTQLVSKLHEILQPFVLRRVKADVDSTLPRKKEMVLYAQMSERQRRLSDCISRFAVGGSFSDLCATLEHELGHFDPRGMNMNNALMQLRKIANHPDLFTGNHDGSVVLPSPEENIEVCGKMKLLEKLLDRLRRGGHKVLIFSQMTMMLDILESHLSQQGLSPCRIDGSVSLEDRRRQIDEFNADPDVFIFLLSTRAGGLGINLTGADTVVIYDSDWNPHQDLQAMDRCHRIGQTRPVHVYRLATAHSVEGKMLEVAGSKLALDRVVMKQGTFSDGLQKGSSVDVDELRKLMAKEVSGGGVAQSADISDADLDRLMDRSDLEKSAPAARSKPAIAKVGPGWEVVDAKDSSALLSGVHATAAAA